jgi:hypothetical protein
VVAAAPSGRLLGGLVQEPGGVGVEVVSRVPDVRRLNACTTVGAGVRSTGRPVGGVPRSLPVRSCVVVWSAGEKDELPAGPVGCVLDVDDGVAVGGQGRFDFGSLTEAQGGVGREGRAVAGKSRASPWIQLTRSAPGLALATPSDARAGSTPIASKPRSSRSSAKVPGPHPRSRTRRDCSSPAICRSAAAVGIEGVVDGRQSGMLEDVIGHPPTVRGVGR